MKQNEFFDSIRNKKMKEAAITLDCGCQMIYLPVTEEVFGKPCPEHTSMM
jgi:hypothetical protein